MQISLIVAMARHRVMGKDNQMPWHLPADLKHFKQLTLNKPVVMGRKTYESIGRPLPNRRNIVISRRPDLSIEGVEVEGSVEAALQKLQLEPEVMVIGGQNLFEQVMPIANKMYLTLIDLEVAGDTFFPEWVEQEWVIVAEQLHTPDEKNPQAYRFLELKRSPAR